MKFIDKTIRSQKDEILLIFTQIMVRIFNNGNRTNRINYLIIKNNIYDIIEIKYKIAYHYAMR